MSEPISAFAMYSLKRKSLDSSPNSKKLKKKHVPLDKKVVDKNKMGQGKIEVPPAQKIDDKPDKVANGVKTTEKQTNIPKKSGVSVSVKKKKRVTFKTISHETNLMKAKGKEVKPKSKNSLVAVNSGVSKMKQIKKKTNTNKKSTKKVDQPTVCNISHLSLDYQPTDNDQDDNPLKTTRSMFEWLIHPMKVDDFFQQNWEKTPVQIKRNFPKYYRLLMSTPMLDKILRDSHIIFSKNIDITSYENGMRETHNPPGRAVPSVVWDYYLNGCSVRMLNPQTYIPKLHALNATLQEFFGCFVGANSYLTPPNSQGFAPHYDDIEAFILQVEGKKRWRLYKPRYENQYLPRYSSRNFADSEIGEPILDTIVNAGDLLYFPRGTIHQGETIDDTHSLHITLSVYQKNSWGDFLEKLLPDALRTAIDNDCEFREGLPLDYLRYTGFAHTGNDSSPRGAFKEKLKTLFNRVMEYIDIDKAADIMAVNHIHDFLPPVLSEGEQECSVLQDGERMTANGMVENRVEIEPDTRIRLLRSHCLRLVEEDGVDRIYYSTENSKEYHEYEPQFLEIGKEYVPAVQEIILRYPEYIRVEDLPIEGDDNKIQIVKDLWEKCIVVTDNPLCIIE